MKKVFALSLVALAANAETWSGTIVDVTCRGKDAANHTRQCALSCAKSGYGLVLSDGKFVKLDETGNAITLSKLKASGKDKDLKAKVTGKRDGEVIKAESVELQ
ncbi:MAG: hypothetical protein LC126_14460 [Bryobacterales bacterium]|nr:hypothetical protein [Bryobacterales bacterium]